MVENFLWSEKFVSLEKLFENILSLHSMLVGKFLFQNVCMCVCVCMWGRKIFWFVFCCRKFIVLIDIFLVQKNFVSIFFRLNFFSSLKMFKLLYQCMCICVCVSVCVCVYMFVFVFVNVCACVFVFLCMCPCLY